MTHFFRKQIIGPYKCPRCGAWTDFHCKPWLNAPGSLQRTGSVWCRWRRCPECRYFGVPGGRWIPKNPEDDK